MFKKDLSWKIYSLLPIILILIILTLIPLVNIFYNSFFDIRWDDGAYVYTFIGLQNYLELPNNKFYFPGLKNTVITQNSSIEAPSCHNETCNIIFSLNRDIIFNYPIGL